MDESQIINEIRRLVQNARTGEALDLLVQIRPDATILMTSFKDTSKQYSLGLIDFKENGQKMNQITFGILEMLKSDPPPPPQPSINGKMKILMLSSSPSGQAKLNLEKEHLKISVKIQDKLEKISLNYRQAVDKTEFREFTETYRPDILHFSGHGEKGRMDGGLILQNDDKNGSEVLSGRALGFLFQYFIQTRNLPIKAVVLNACFSGEQAEAIAQYVPYVIGTTIDIGDTLAIAFSTGYYYYLAEQGPKFEEAFQSGRIAAIIEGAEESDFLLYKNGQITTI